MAITSSKKRNKRKMNKPKLYLNGKTSLGRREREKLSGKTSTLTLSKPLGGVESVLFTYVLFPLLNGLIIVYLTAVKRKKK